MNKKKVFALALAVCLIAILSVGTLAWFSDDDAVTNKFNVADSDNDGEADFSVDVKETGDEEDDGLIFDDIQPGDVLDKEAKVINTGAYNEYIRVLVEITDRGALIAALEEEYPEGYPLEECFIDFDPAMWESVEVKESGDMTVIVAYYDGILASGGEITLFKQVKIPEELTVSDVNNMGLSFDINVKAHAVQADNTGVTTASEAFDLVGWAWNATIAH